MDVTSILAVVIERRQYAKMVRHLFALCTISATLAPPASGQTQSPPSWQVDRLDLDVVVRPSGRMLAVSGVTDVTALRPGTQGPVLALGPNGVAFDSAKVPAPATLRISDKRDSLFISLPNPVAIGQRVSINFFAHANRDLERSLIRDEGAMISWGAAWYPVVVNSALGNAVQGLTRITVPIQWRTLAPGQLIDSAVTRGGRTEVWRVVRPTARSFIAAAFARQWIKVDSSMVAVNLLPRHVNRSKEYAVAIPKMVRTLSKYFGPYPFPTFGIAELPREVAPPGIGGRSEPGYFIAHTDALEVEGVNVALFAHELAHMWFPGAVDTQPPGDDMIDEGIATYAVALYRESTETRSAAKTELLEGSPAYSRRAYFHEVRMGRDLPLMTGYDRVISQAKGPTVYDMLRKRIGDQAFFGVWQDLTARRGSFSLADLRKLYIDRVPADSGLPAFLSQWMDRTGAPVIELVQQGRRVTLVQRSEPFTIGVPLRLHTSRTVRDTTITLATRSQTFVVPKGTKVELDPLDEVLMWKPRFGPPLYDARAWDNTRWRRWLQDEIKWLMNAYAVEGVSVAVVQKGIVTWTEHYGKEKTGDVVAASGALGTKLKTSSDSVAVRSLTAASEVVTFTAGVRTGQVGVVVMAKGGWGGRQLTRHVAERVAIQYGWKEALR